MEHQEINPENQSNPINQFDAPLQHEKIVESETTNLQDGNAKNIDANAADALPTSPKTPLLHLSICMGSSCFSRGNDKNLDLIERFLAQHDCEAQVDLVGGRCENQCCLGPNLKINGQEYHQVHEELLLKLLNQLLTQNQQNT